MKLRNKKSGEVGEIRCENHALYIDTDGGFTYWFRNLAELNELWEDFKPKEPLIMDENVRKILRAWNALFDDEPIRVKKYPDYISLFKDDIKGYSSSVCIDLPYDVFNEKLTSDYYTIGNLCGDEE